MTPKYPKCHRCGGTVRGTQVMHEFRWQGKVSAVFDRVPAGVCRTCGETYFHARILRRLEEIALQGA